MARREDIYPRVVRARNDGSEPFSARYDGLRYIIQPNSETLIPWEAMCLWFGHPDAMDIDKKRRYRSDEVKRLDVKYGIYEQHHLRTSGYPQVSVWNISTGQRIITVVDDPEGKHINPDTRTAAQNESLQEQVRQMQEQLAAMQTLVANQGSNNTGLTATEVIDHIATEGEDRPELRKTEVPADDTPSDGAEIDTPSRVKAPARAN